MIEQLVLCPGHAQGGLIKLNSLLAAIRQAGLIGSKTDNQLADSFQPGDNFTGQISFLGCSPTIKNADGSQQSTVQVILHKSGARFLGGENITSPSCPGCKYKYNNWQALLQQWQTDNETVITCPECKTKKLIPRLNWHYRAAFSDCEIIINHISEGVALPADSLLKILKRHTNCHWKYFYRQYFYRQR
jgi:uncharacterized protein (UPF0248 family)